MLIAFVDGLFLGCVSPPFVLYTCNIAFALLIICNLYLCYIGFVLKHDGSVLVGLLVFILPCRFVLTYIGCLTRDVPRPLAHVAATLLLKLNFTSDM